MRIVYINNVRIPTEKAHGYAIMKMCEEMSTLGVETSLIVPFRVNPISADPYTYYGIARTFPIRFVHGVDAFRFLGSFPRIAFLTQSMLFLLRLGRENIPKDAVIITRNPEIAWWFGRRGYAVFYDAHNFPETKKRLLAFFLKHISGIIANSTGTEQAFRLAGFPRVLRAQNGVDLKAFSAPAGTRPHDLVSVPGRIAMYVGHLYAWKGVDTVVETARRAHGQGISFVFVGGTEGDMLAYKKKCADMDNVFFLGHKTKPEIPQYMKSADVLLLPNIPVTKESELYTSPIKMFEYMASGVPIVASDLPSVREILNEKNATLVPAGNPDALLVGISRALSDEGGVVAVTAREDVKRYTWSARARDIFAFLRQKQEDL